LLFLINFQFKVRNLRLKNVVFLLRVNFIGSFVRKMIVILDIRLIIIWFNFFFFRLKLPLKFEVLWFSTRRFFNFDFWGILNVSDLLFQAVINSKLLLKFLLQLLYLLIQLFRHFCHLFFKLVFSFLTFCFHFLLNLQDLIVKITSLLDIILFVVAYHIFFNTYWCCLCLVICFLLSQLVGWMFLLFRQTYFVFV
jgi:hypothetical protein